eukprot:CAMPEP_0115033036 /NCGR_PEP_ID=MMETSP0216-20121206/39582_1 /TAXON_ID=223996 /ORGANISM="Protocruzia adherens, Strain Boccale" /LENGTH=163 /DNA_ID=CAMNT_0002411185 /DNA_START=23 /DNA_END=514 /DNA_ORIENTATION=+
MSTFRVILFALLAGCLFASEGVATEGSENSKAYEDKMLACLKIGQAVWRTGELAERVEKIVEAKPDEDQDQIFDKIVVYTIRDCLKEITESDIKDVEDGMDDDEKWVESKKSLVFPNESVFYLDDYTFTSDEDTFFKKLMDILEKLTSHMAYSEALQARVIDL